MAKCHFCDKSLKFGKNIAFARSRYNRTTNRTFKPNLRRVKAKINGTPQHIRVCARCLKSGKVVRA